MVARFASGASQRGLGWRPLASGCTTLIVVGVVALMIGTSTATPAMSVATTTKFVAPYSGSEEGVVFTGFSGCGVTGSAPAQPFFNLTNGHGYANATAAAHSCGSTGSSVFADALPEFMSNVFVTTSGHHHFRANWKLDFSVHLSARPGNSSQLASAGLQVTVDLSLLNLSSGKSIYRSNFPVALEQTISSGSYAHTFSNVRESVYLNTTLSAGDAYSFETDVEVGVYLSVSPGSSTASASVNMETGGRSANLLSVTVS